ncbi:hypothetical protein MLD38_003715 [Melastoma candidum]|uniref:Uncharacterized protein n=1 Tax=Melastoma candidum TaxID=119954 RepID=A0ACB9S3H4_9MYRT|nr:hypothetical protein MLD38_003715 [Melastoma candidum]
MRAYSVYINVFPGEATTPFQGASQMARGGDEPETRSQPDSISVIVHYGNERTNSPQAISEHGLVLMTYGVLASAFKDDGEECIYHGVEWHRVVLDEAHTIKSWRTQNARAAFTLAAYCLWCLVRTPIQTNETGCMAGDGMVEERLEQVQARKQRMITGEVRSARVEELEMLFI